MANILDYLDWRGDIPLSPNFPLNEVDSVILSRFSYLEMEKISMDEGDTIGSLCKKIQDNPDNVYHIAKDRELADKLVMSRRFSSLKVSDFEIKKDANSQEQFAAVAVHLPGSLLISFRGTDASVIGWKEDLNMAFMTEVPAQRSGLAYTIQVAEKYPEMRLLLAGHSKGGNIALYSALYLPPEVTRRIARVDNFDGPGFQHQVIEENANDDLIPKLHTYCPVESIIGQLLEHVEEQVIVASLSSGLQQHNVYHWQVERDRLKREEALTQHSQVMNGMFEGWLAKASLEQRETFADALYKIYSSTEAETVGEFNRSVVKNAPTILKTFRDMTGEEKKTAIEMLLLFGRTYLGSYMQSNNVKELKDAITMEMGDIFTEDIDQTPPAGTGDTHSPS